MMFLDGWSWNGYALASWDTVWTLMLLAVAVIVLLTPPKRGDSQR